MKRNNQRLLAFAIPIFLMAVSCAQRPGYRYRTISKTQISKDSLVEVSTMVLPAGESAKPGKTAFDFSDKGQEAYIQALEKMAKDQFADFRTMLNKKILFPAEDKNPVDLKSVKKHVVFSVSEKDFYGSIPEIISLGDRIEKLKITVVLPSDAIVKFTDWDMFNTKFGTFNIGTRSSTLTKEFNINPSIPIYGGAANLSLGSYGRKRETSISDTLKKRYVSLTGILKDDRFILEQTGTPQIDLAGNFGLDLVISLKSLQNGLNPGSYYSVDDLRDDKGKFNAPKSVTFSRSRYNFISANNDIKASLVCNYVVRHINGKGANTFAEEDDDIIYYLGKFTSEITLLEKSDVKPHLYYLFLDDSALQILNTTLNKHEDLAFQTEGEAMDFLEWLVVTYNTLHVAPNPLEINFQDYKITIPDKIDLKKQIKVRPI
jgi:hypothetical protein